MLITAVAGCSSGHRPASTGTAPIRADNWTAPVVSGPASPANYCTLLVSVYRHEAQLPEAATTKVKERILQDYVNTVPKIEDEAPAPISGPSRTYLGSVSKLLSDLIRAGLDSSKLPKGSLTSILLDPAIKSAGNQVLAYSHSHCHYDISG